MTETAFRRFFYGGNMSVLISGNLFDGAGKPVIGCAIELRAKKTSPTVVVHVVATCITDQSGRYAINAEPGFYDVTLFREGWPPAKAGEIYVTPTDAPDTLNAFLDAPKDGDLRPEVMKRFEAMVNTVIRLSEQVTQDATEAVKAAQQAEKKSATSAKESKASADKAVQCEQNAQQHARQASQDRNVTTTARNDAERFALEAKQSAAATAADREVMGEYVKRTEQNATSSAQSAKDAAASAAVAEQAKKDINTSLVETLKIPNRLSEIALEGEGAQQESRDNLGLKKAATMEPQSDIHDRTKGRLPIPGAFGFGHIFKPNEKIRFDSAPEFLDWVKRATPGEYLVEGSSQIIPGVIFIGMIRIWWLESQQNPPNPRSTAKAIIFYGINGDIYYNRYWTNNNGYLIGWENLKCTSHDIINTLSGMASGTTDAWYCTGSLVLAAYNGKGDRDPDRMIKRGCSYPGSRLTPVELTCYGTTGTGVRYNVCIAAYVQGSGAGMPGTYRALSGSELGSAGSSSVIIGLFIRIA